MRAYARARLGAVALLLVTSLACVKSGPLSERSTGTPTGSATPDEDAIGLQVDEQDASALRIQLLSALERRDATTVWALLGPGPRAQFEGSEARFARWCERYCGEWLIEAAATNPRPTERVTWGAVVVQLDGGDARVVAGPGVPAGRSLDAALARLCETLRALGSDPLYAEKRRSAWLRLEAGLARATARPGPADASWTLTVDGGDAVFIRDGERWSVLRFDTAPF